MPVKFHPNNPIDALEKIIVKEDGSPLRGEIDVYRMLYADLAKSEVEWDVWHDLKLPEHSDVCNYYKKTTAQIDFLIASKLGILILEVKGGAISFSDNIFYYGRNTDSRMKQNPFKQAEGYKYTLKDLILNNVTKCFFCEAVAFPHVDYPFESKLIDQTQLWTFYNAVRFGNSIETFIVKLFNSSKERHRKHFRAYSELSDRDLISIKKILSPLIEDKNSYFRSDSTTWLGLDNIEILEGLYKNPRIMLEGPPGTGKTIIAKAYMDRQIGKSGIFLCWNNFLMHHIRSMMNDRIGAESIEITTFFRFFQSLNPHLDFSILSAFNEDQFYQLVKTTIENLNFSGNLKSYDYIVIDEAQDLFDRGLDLLINAFCGNNSCGLENGNSLILYDIDQSYGSSGRAVKEIADLMCGYYTHFRLHEDKRSVQNPDIRKVASQLLDNCSILLDADFILKYPGVQIGIYSSLLSIKRQIVSKVLTPMRDSNSSLLGKDCILLIQSDLMEEGFRGDSGMRYELLAIKDVEELNTVNLQDDANVLRYTSILKYKGLEKKNVFLIITEPNNRNVYEIYVGLTRAMLNIEIFILR